MDYLGRKTALIGAIGSAIEARTRPPARILDAFAGTGAVSSSLRALGYKVDANDLLPLSAIWCTALLHGSARSTFSSLSGELKLFPGTRYLQVLDALNNIAPRTGWVTRNYSPASLKHSDVERRYLTVANARHIDAIREQLRKWKPTLSRAEYALLMSSLIDAVSRVSNIAGTYGSYLKEWKRSALKALTLEPIDFGRGSTSGHSVTHVDAEIAVAESAAEVVYADPPYTKRQYAAYYHLLNTIATGEEPLLKGLTGLPNWREWSSDWCHMSKAQQALERLIGKSSSPHLLLSYSSDGHIDHATVMDTMSMYGVVSFSETVRPRYRSSQLPHKGVVVLERLYAMSR